MINSHESLWKLEWSPDGKTVVETIFPDGRKYSVVKWKINELRRTTHKSGSLVPVKLASATVQVSRQ